MPCDDYTPKCPQVLPFRGELSHLLSAEVAATVAREDANCQLAVVPGSGHSIALDRLVGRELAVGRWLQAEAALSRADQQPATCRRGCELAQESSGAIPWRTAYRAAWVLSASPVFDRMLLT